MRKYIILLSAIGGGIWFGKAYSSAEGWEWIMQIGFGVFVGWSVSSVLLKASGNQKSSKHTDQVIGIVTKIGYSSVRINNMPRLKVTVRIRGIERDFEPLDPDLQFSIKIGSKAVVYANPDDIKNAFFDTDQTIKFKAEQISA